MNREEIKDMVMAMVLARLQAAPETDIQQAINEAIDDLRLALAEASPQTCDESELLDD